MKDSSRRGSDHIMISKGEKVDTMHITGGGTVRRSKCGEVI